MTEDIRINVPAHTLVIKRKEPRAIKHEPCCAAVDEVRELRAAFAELGEILKTGGMEDPAFICGAVRALVELL
jgi:hypothetical protein